MKAQARTLVVYLRKILFNQAPCDHCNAWTKTNDLTETTQTSLWLCQDCLDETCQRCLEGTPELEDSHGEYICLDCHTSEIDWAYDSLRDKDWS